MKQILAFLIVLLLTLGAIACSASTDAQNENKSSLENNSTLSKVALEVSTIT